MRATVDQQEPVNSSDHPTHPGEPQISFSQVSSDDPPPPYSPSSIPPPSLFHATPDLPPYAERDPIDNDPLEMNPISGELPEFDVVGILTDWRQRLALKLFKLYLILFIIFFFSLAVFLTISFTVSDLASFFFSDLLLTLLMIAALIACVRQFKHHYRSGMGTTLPPII